MVKSHFNLADRIMLDSLDGLAEIKQKPVIVGGLAVQLHGLEMTSLLRDTLDIDVITFEDYSFEGFSEQIFPVLNTELRKKGYTVQKKRGRNHTAKIMLNENHPNMEQLLIHFTVFEPEVRSRLRDYVEKQIVYSKPVTLASKFRVQVASLEEMVPLKLQRSIRFGVDRETLVGPIYGSLINHAIKGNWGYLAGMPISEWKEKIETMQRDVSDNPTCLEEVNTYKLSKDIYDLCFAARIISDSISTFDKDRYEANLVRIIQRKETLITDK